MANTWLLGNVLACKNKSLQVGRQHTSSKEVVALLEPYCEPLGLPTVLTPHGFNTLHLAIWGSLAEPVNSVEDLVEQHLPFKQFRAQILPLEDPLLTIGVEGRVCKSTLEAFGYGFVFVTDPEPLLFFHDLSCWRVLTPKAVGTESTGAIYSNWMQHRVAQYYDRKHLQHLPDKPLILESGFQSDSSVTQLVDRKRGWQSPLHFAVNPLWEDNLPIDFLVEQSEHILVADNTLKGKQYLLKDKSNFVPHHNLIYCFVRRASDNHDEMTFFVNYEQEFWGGSEVSAGQAFRTVFYHRAKCDPWFGAPY